MVETQTPVKGFEKALKDSIEYCKKHTVLGEFLTKYEDEVKENMLWEWNEEEARRVYCKEACEDAYNNGRAEGYNNGRVEGRADALLASIRSLADKLSCNAEAAMDLLNISIADRNLLRPLL